jgi:hypothetical protein
VGDAVAAAIDSDIDSIVSTVAVGEAAAVAVAVAIRVDVAAGVEVAVATARPPDVLGVGVAVALSGSCPEFSLRCASMSAALRVDVGGTLTVDVGGTLTVDVGCACGLAVSAVGTAVATATVGLAGGAPTPGAVFCRGCTCSVSRARAAGGSRVALAVSMPMAKLAPALIRTLHIPGIISAS